MSFTLATVIYAHGSLRNNSYVYKAVKLATVILYSSQVTNNYAHVSVMFIAVTCSRRLSCQFLHANGNKEI